MGEGDQQSQQSPRLWGEEEVQLMIPLPLGSWGKVGVSQLSHQYVGLWSKKEYKADDPTYSWV